MADNRIKVIPTTSENGFTYTEEYRPRQAVQVTVPQTQFNMNDSNLKGFNWQVKTTPGGGGVTPIEPPVTPPVGPITGIDTVTVITLPNGSYNSIAYGNGTFVAVGDGGYVAVSTNNGLTWTTYTMPGNWKSVAFGGGGFTAVNNTTVLQSSDGISWTQVANIVASVNQIRYVASKWVIACDGSVMSSSDGSTWVQTPVPGNWTDVAYSGTSYIMTGTNVVTRSTDLATWSTVGVTGTWQAATYANSQYVITGNGGRLAYSTNDGLGWYQADNSHVVWEDVAFGSNLFLAVSSGYNVVYTNNNGAQWNNASASAALLSVAYGSAVFCAVGGNKVARITLK